MSTPNEKALAYLDTLEAHRRMALEISEQKAEEAKLIKARQEGFQAAMKILGLAIRLVMPRTRIRHPIPRQPGRRRVRRHIRELILRELSFSGQAMTATQIAKAVDYQDRTNGNGAPAHGRNRPSASECRGPMGNRQHSYGSTQWPRCHRR